MIKVRTNIVCVTFTAAILGMGLTGCESMNNTQRGAILGSGGGALAGAIIGHQVGKKKEGALIGALAGGAGGALLGRNEDVKEERDAAYAQASYERNQRHVQAKRMMNKEVIDMARQGISDQTIIQAIQNNGVEFRGTSDEIIWMQKNGVSQTVMAEMQKHAIQ